MNQTHYNKAYLITILCLGLASCAFGFLNSMDDFESYIRPLCYNKTSNGQTFINGQEEPLSQTFDNFLDLVEKLEEANPHMELSDLLFVILKNYTHENIKPNDQGFVQEKPNVDIHFFNELWEQDDRPITDEDEKPLPENVNPLSDSEICSLFYMLSHAVNDNPIWFDDQTIVQSPIRDGIQRSESAKHPREKGIVVMRSTDETIAMSRVLLGLYEGLKGQERNAKDIAKKKTKSLPDDSKFKPVDIFTLADTLIYNVLPPKTKEMGQEVNALSVGNRGIINNEIPASICPTTFQLAENASSMYTYSLVRGGIDGLILGKIIKQVTSVSSTVRLSQILRSYYSHRGIQLPSSNGQPTLKYSTCNRLENFFPLTDELKNQIQILTVIISTNASANDIISRQAYEAIENKPELIHRDCVAPKANNLPCETPVDIVVVLDTKSNKINRQKTIVGLLANKLDLLHDGSSITVLLDQLKENTDFNLTEIVPRSFSSAAVSCAIVQRDIEGSSIDRDRTIQALEKFLSDRKKDDRDLHGAPGKIVLYFNFEDQETETTALTNALNNFRRLHNDVSVFAVGENGDVLKKYVGLNNHGVLRLVDRDATALVDELAEKMCSGPAALQYSDCRRATDERSAVFEGFVTRGSIQQWVMDERYFEKSFNARIVFDTENGNNVRVCHNRVPKPQKVDSQCENSTSAKRRLEFKLTNPCDGLVGPACPSVFFSVIGSELEEKDPLKYCSDERCKSLDQVKFRVTHDGIRCSGCSSLFSSSLLMFLSLLCAYVLCSNK